MRDRPMLRIHRPRGRGFNLRYRVPAARIGTVDPKTGRKFGKMLTEGLSTTDHRNARRRAQVRVGKVQAR